MGLGTRVNGLMLCVAFLATISVVRSNEPLQFKKTYLSATHYVSSLHRTSHSSSGRAVDCVDGSKCLDDQTCCPFFTNGTYGCCAGDQNTCCSLSVGRDTCCPRNSKCCFAGGCCGNSADCCSDGGCCQPNQDCCGEFCCNSVLGASCCGGRRCCAGDCCPDHSCCGAQQTCCGDFCCPSDYTCCNNVNFKGCCHGRDATCCDNGICCPTGTRCCGVNQCCQLGHQRGDVVIPDWTYPAMIKHARK